MKKLRLILALLALSFLPLPAHAIEPGRFQQLVIKAPKKPLGLIFLISDMEGWRPTQDNLANDLVEDGWLVVGIDLRKYRHNLRKSGDTCHDVGDELIALSQQLQRELKISGYMTPVIAGFGEGGVLAYATIKQALPASFSAGFSIRGDGLLRLPQPLCTGPAYRQVGGGLIYDMTSPLGVPFQIYESWPGLAEFQETLDKFQQGEDAVNALSQLPLTVLPADGASDYFVVFLSGDGGWRDIDKTIAEELEKKGIPVVGWDSLRYFWSHKEPEVIAADLGRVINHYSKVWKRSKVALIGYSFGADVIPMAYNHLPPNIQQNVIYLGLLALSEKASLEVEVEGFIGVEGENDVPTLPDVLRLPVTKVQCVYGGDDEEDSLCPQLAAKGYNVVRTEGGHHFDNDYEALSNRMIDVLKKHD